MRASPTLFEHQQLQRFCSNQSPSYHARMARRAQHLRSERADNRLDKSPSRARAACVSTWLGEAKIHKNEIVLVDDRRPCLTANVVRPCCREAAALRRARHAKRGGAARPQNGSQRETTSPFIQIKFAIFRLSCYFRQCCAIILGIR